MSGWKVVLTRAEYAVFRRTDQQTLLQPQFDAQVGDDISVYVQGNKYVQHRAPVIHVLQNVAGIKRGFLVITLKNSDAEYYRTGERNVRSRNEQLIRSNAALRGQITKLCKRLAAIPR